MFSPRTVKEIHVLLLDPLPQEECSAFRDKQYVVDECFKTLSEAELVKKIGSYNIVCISGDRSEEYLTDEVLRSAHRLLAIGVFGSLLNQVVDLKTAQQMGIPVFTSPFQHQHSVAELQLSAIVLLSRQIGDRSREIHRGEWNKTSSNCNEVRGKTLGIVGYGHAGSQLGVMAEALSLRVLFFDTQSIMSIGRAEPMDSLDELLGQSDYVAINVSNSPENAGLFGQDTLNKMKKKSYLINMYAPDVVEHIALANALQSGHLAGAAIDAFPSTLIKDNVFTSPLQKLKNVILTPSIASDTMEARIRVVEEVTMDIARYVVDGTTIGAVNFPSVAAWPLKPNTRRIICMHHNVRGVLREIDNILSAYNVGKQILDTKDTLGYLIADVATDQVTAEIVSQLAMLANTIRTRII